MVNTMRISSISVKNGVLINAFTAGVPCKGVAEEMVVEKITGTLEFKKN